MAAMNKTQREHLLSKLRKMAEAALDKRFGHDILGDGDVPEEAKVSDKWTLAQLLVAIKAGTVIANPYYATDRLSTLYGSIDEYLVLSKGLGSLEAQQALMKDRPAVKKALDEALEAVEDRLIFEDVAGVTSIIEGFELTIKRALTPRK